MRILFFIVSLFIFNSLGLSQKKFKRDFYFDYAKYELDSLELKSAQKFKKILDKFELTKVEIIGHTDSDGSESYNLKLSSRRIESVKMALNIDLPDSLFVLKPKGEQEPQVENTDSTKHQNRRVTVKAYYSKKKVTTKKKVKPKKPHPANEINQRKILDEKDLVTGKVISLPWINFHGGTDAFLPGAEEILASIIPVLKENPEVKIEIAGHICCGNDMELSVKRAKKVFDFLVINGVSAKNLTYKGYNNTQPMFRNIMDIRNRRVELRVLEG